MTECGIYPHPDGIKTPATARCTWGGMNLETQRANLCTDCYMQLWEKIKGLVNLNKMFFIIEGIK